jgi:metal-responsive CopG/Arc/MetJ family transcriptional regulator
MTWDEELIELVDRVVKELKTTRSSFTRRALREAIDRINNQRLEERHRKGYQLKPVTQYEFSVWEDEQDWGDE